MNHLPAELIQGILSDYGLGRSDCHAVARTSHNLNPIAIALLYSSISFSEQHEIGCCIRCLNILASSRNALLVKSLSCAFRLDGQNQQDFWPALTTALRRTQKLRILRLDISGTMFSLGLNSFLGNLESSALPDLEEIYTTGARILYLAAGRPCKAATCNDARATSSGISSLLIKLRSSIVPLERLSIRLPDAREVITIDTIQSIAHHFCSLISLEIIMPISSLGFAHDVAAFLAPIISSLPQLEVLATPGYYNFPWPPYTALDGRHPSPLDSEHESIMILGSSNSRLRRVQLNIVWWSISETGNGDHKGGWTPCPGADSWVWWTAKYGVGARDEMLRRWGHTYDDSGASFRKVSVLLQR
ncbi:hypothetical protein FRB95_004461 [Tulasnella sp. JGI-2019a]|nr:hypothetical protein FRB95_004461 [Tulasnella sp. JGI-2019a]